MDDTSIQQPTAAANTPTTPSCRSHPPLDTLQLQDGNKTDQNHDPEALLRIVTTPSVVSRPSTLPSEVLFVAVVCSAQFMTQAGLGQVIAILQIIGDSFGSKGGGDTTWYAAGYSLTVGTFILIAGRLGDVYGHRLMFVIGFSWFGLWSLLAGFSVWSNQFFFYFCRAFQGIGPALLLPNAIAILGRTYQRGRRKDMVFSIFGTTAPGGFVVGSLFASLFTELAWWPWAFWVMGIACISLAVLGAVVIPCTPRPPFQDKIPWSARLDIAGACTGITALILINVAWNQGPLVGWKTPYTYVLLLIGFAFLAIFAFIEQKARDPLLPRSVFTGDLGWVLGCIAAGWSSFGILVLYYFQFMQTVEGDGPLLTTAKWSPVALSGCVAAVTTGFLLNRLAPSTIMLTAMLAFTVGLTLFATIPVGQIYWAQAFIIVIVTPWGM